MTKNSESTIYNLCSKERFNSFINKISIWNLSFMRSPITAKLIEVNDDALVLEMRDGRILVARLGTIVGFGMIKKQPLQVV